MKFLQKKGYEVHAAASPARGQKAVLENKGIVCWEVDFPRRPISYKIVKAKKQIQRILEQEQFKGVHVHTPIPSFLTRFCLRKREVTKVLYTVHGYHFYKGSKILNWLIFFPIEKIASKWTDGKIVINKEDLDTAQKKLGFEFGENLFFVDGVGIELNEFQNFEKKNYFKLKRGLREKDLVVVCIAEFTKNKNHQFLLDVWEKVNQKVKNAHLFLIGDGFLKKALQNKVFAKELKNVHFLGYRQDIAEILKETDVVVLTSLREGLPRNIMEAMATKTPVIAFNIRGCKDLVYHNKTGFLVEKQNKKDFEEKLTRLLLDHELRKQMGIQANKEVQKYSVEKIIPKIEAIYKKILSS